MPESVKMFSNLLFDVLVKKMQEKKVCLVIGAGAGIGVNVAKKIFNVWLSCSDFKED